MALALAAPVSWRARVSVAIWCALAACNSRAAMMVEWWSFIPWILTGIWSTAVAIHWAMHA